ncbi:MULTISPECIES: alpha/beta fold hydrolase [Bacillus]|uniref:alpha/beta fold hydrolase n=1 Tax=Bacillus TaxID=1386 RepID=UPI00047DA0A4|nr:MULTISPECIES: alpha/beta hydrolase [Bacillus]QHZ45801.1 alpha/beta hydrolase [Bacillus sp. NSP9.1]WFA04335.1 alpha/beta hydrolase [Bacillus sp. HSf4]
MQLSKPTTQHIHGVNIYYEHYENPGRTTLILIHGFLSSSFCYRKLIPLLKNEFNIITLDLPPFGQSEKSQTFVYTYQNMARVVIGLIERLKITEAVLVGHSMGGQISLYAVKERPELFKKVVLLCSSGYLTRAPRRLIFGSHIPYFHLYIKRWLSKQGVLKNLMNVVYDKSLIDQDMIDGYLKPFLDDQIFRALARLIRHREGDLAPDELKQIETPSLLIWGEEDRVVPVQIGKRLHQDLPNSSFYSLKHTGHLVPEENPDFVSDKIANFVIT